MSNIQNSELWLCNRFINCSYHSNPVIRSYAEDFWMFSDGMTFKYMIEIPPAMYENKGLDIIELHKSMLRQGIYVGGFWDEYYIPNKSAYQVRHYYHDHFVVGFDDEKQIFRVVGYWDDGRYGYRDVCYHDYYQSVVCALQDKVTMCYYRFNKDYVLQLDDKHIKRELENYLYSRKGKEFVGTELAFGFEAWDKLVELVEEIEHSGDTAFEIKHSRCYVEHRLMMYRRIKVLYQYGLFEQSDIIQRYYDKVACQAEIVHKLCIKSNLSHNMALLKTVREMMMEINQEEKLLIAELLARWNENTG
ncbi:MAG: hypothetical protein J6B85_13355 [Lachnospiraceae bacterium]|nr:hypothetical protein [Lachnospiraceae bacterium]